jgi:nucleoside-diphosphate-sugar epimerase
MNHSYYFSREKAEAALGYRPLYTWNESFVMSANYYMALGYGTPT